VIRQHLPALQVILPLLAAPACLLLRRAGLAWLFATVVGFATFAIAILLLRQVLSQGDITYALGGWSAPWGIQYYVDPVSALVLLIVSGISAVVLPYAARSVAREIPSERRCVFYTLFLLCLAGMLGIAITGDAFNLFVFLEISSLSSYALISMGQDRRALTSSYQYLIMGTIGATFILIGVGLLYVMTGTLNMQDLAQRLPAVATTRTIHTAFAFLVVGLSLKLALFPLHLWLPNAYTFAPSVVTTFLAATATKVAFYALLRFVFTIFGAEYAFNTMPLGPTLMLLALLGLFVASAVAIFQENIKRILAYSSVAQIGYMILGISFATVTGVSAGILHLFNHALMKGALFMAVGAIFLRTGSMQLQHLAGIGRRMPWTMAAVVIGGLSLIGVPLTVGFISKWYLIQAALERGWWPVAVLVLIGSLLALVYVWRILEAAYFDAPAKPDAHIKEAPLSLLIPTWALVLANIYFGIDTSLTVGVARQAASLLLGVQP